MIPILTEVRRERLHRAPPAGWAIITIDAKGTQKAIAERVVAGGADYFLSLKGNQETLHQADIDRIDEQLEGDRAEAQERETWPRRRSE